MVLFLFSKHRVPKGGWIISPQQIEGIEWSQQLKYVKSGLLNIGRIVIHFL